MAENERYGRVTIVYSKRRKLIVDHVSADCFFLFELDMNRKKRFATLVATGKNVAVPVEGVLHITFQDYPIRRLRRS